MPLTNVLPNAPVIDNHLDMGFKHSKLHAMAMTHGGACIKKFSQGSDDNSKGVGLWYHQRNKNNGSRWAGICKAMSVYWISSHATDVDFWGWLTRNSTTISQESAIHLCDLHGSYSSRNDHGNFATRSELGMTKHQWMAFQLGKAGVVERTSISNGGSLSHDSGFTSANSRLLRGRQIATALAENPGCYKQLSFHRSGGGHATALWVGDDVTFFDPNYGEFWFERRANFQRWFELFWLECYGHYNASFQISNWGKAWG